MEIDLPWLDRPMPAWQMIGCLNRMIDTREQKVALSEGSLNMS
jgi:hypothetical protein